MAPLGPDTSATDLIGREFGPYTLVQRLGVGGMAETFEAVRHGRSGFTQRVCLKLIRPAFWDDDDSIELFEREARLAAKLQHSNIVGVIDFGEIDGTIYMALELVDGADLQLLLDVRHRLSADHVALLGHELAAALDHAHDPHRVSEQNAGADGVIHRDISPSNVMISRYGEVKLTDFGLANLAAAGSRQSEVRGKFPYMAPERLRADPLDGRADLFSLGVVLYEALSGRRPFDGGNDPATIMLITEGTHPPLTEFAPEAPPALCRIIEQLIETDPERRPTSAATLLQDFEELVPSPGARRKLGRYALSARSHRTVHKPISSRRLAESEIPERGDTPSPRTTSGTWSRRRALAVGSLATIAFGGLAVALWPRDGSESPARATNDAETLRETRRKDTTPEDEIEPATDVQNEEPRPTKPPDATPPVATPPRPALLTVLVAPWGEIWIDGKPRGTAPLKNEPLKPGRHRISAGQGSPLQTRTVRLRPGQRRTLRFDLTE